MISIKTYMAGLLATCSIAVAAKQSGESLVNPALPGWHSDPSCVFVPERENTTFCTASSFLSIPGLPIYATKDLQNFKLVSHALTQSSEDVIPEYHSSLGQSNGIWAATIRYHKGTFYIATIYNNAPSGQFGIIVNSTDPFSDAAWGTPLRYNATYIDPDIFWDHDDQAYITGAGNYLQKADLATATLGEPKSLWNGTGKGFLEGPHLYKHDGFYYLLAAEGGSGLNHSVVMARSRDLTGPYKSNPANPVLTNRNTTEYFQNIGHADLFQDKHDRWWSSALTWRSGPAGLIYPMGRETVLTPMTWPSMGWPQFTAVRGLEGDRKLSVEFPAPGHGPYSGEPDDYKFPVNSSIPRNFVYWRWPNTTSYAVSPEGCPNTLQLTPSVLNITSGYKNYTAGYDLGYRTMVTRKQTDTLFQYSIDIDFEPRTLHEEAGVTVFLNQVQNHALGIVSLPKNTNTSDGAAAPHFRFVTSALGSLTPFTNEPSIVPVPQDWLSSTIRMYVQAQNDTHYVFSAAPVRDLEERIILGYGTAEILSGGAGDFTGALVGVYATANGGTGTTKAYISRWKYNGLGQEIDNGEYISSSG